MFGEGGGSPWPGLARVGAWLALLAPACCLLPNQLPPSLQSLPSFTGAHYRVPLLGGRVALPLLGVNGLWGSLTLCEKLYQCSNPNIHVIKQPTKSPSNWPAYIKTTHVASCLCSVSKNRTRSFPRGCQTPVIQKSSTKKPVTQKKLNDNSLKGETERWIT